mmetsp:Transcript_26343/g.63448  ORF Transcript_26343/g.63448 Transcript_26343/m.63448 type:complete len:366 (+) Transcript_26343:1072-2169(+)
MTEHQLRIGITAVSCLPEMNSRSLRIPLPPQTISGQVVLGQGLVVPLPVVSSLLQVRCCFFHRTGGHVQHGQGHGGAGVPLVRGLLPHPSCRLAVLPNSHSRIAMEVHVSQGGQGVCITLGRERLQQAQHVQPQCGAGGWRGLQQRHPRQGGGRLLHHLRRGPHHQVHGCGAGRPCHRGRVALQRRPAQLGFEGVSVHQPRHEEVAVRQLAQEVPVKGRQGIGTPRKISGGLPRRPPCLLRCRRRFRSNPQRDVQLPLRRHHDRSAGSIYQSGVSDGRQKTCHRCTQRALIPAPQDQGGGGVNSPLGRSLLRTRLHFRHPFSEPKQSQRPLGVRVRAALELRRELRMIDHCPEGQALLDGLQQLM